MSLIEALMVGGSIAVAVALLRSRPEPPPPPPPGSIIPLSDLTGTYFGFPGLLYPGSNAVPSDHDAAGRGFALQVQPRDAAGFPSPRGKIVFLSVGYSNTRNFWSFYGLPELHPHAAFFTPESLIGQATFSPNVNHDSLVFACGASGGRDAQWWDSPFDLAWDVIRDSELGLLRLTEAQVQAVWLQGVIANPMSLGLTTFADAVRAPTYARALTAAMGDILRAIRVRYPNVKVVFISNMSYTGYQEPDPVTGRLSTLQPEPYAYENGFAHKWVIEAQIEQMRTGAINPVAGDLNYNSGIAPWVAWSGDIWANDGSPRSDGFLWLPGDFLLTPEGTIGIHPGPTGVAKVAGRMLDFFLNSPYTQPWFRA